VGSLNFRLKYIIQEDLRSDNEPIIDKVIDKLRQSNYHIVAQKELNVSFANHGNDLEIISRSESLYKVDEGEVTIINKDSEPFIMKMTYFISYTHEIFVSLFIIAGALFFEYWILILLLAVFISFLYRVDKLKERMKEIAEAIVS